MNSSLKQHRSRRKSVAIAAMVAATVTLAATALGMGSAGEPVRAESCTVSELLVPSCGVWFGASTASRDGTYDYVRGLAEYEAVAQNTPDILHFYKAGASRFPSAKEVAMAERDGLQRSLLLYNWKPSKTLTWRQVADGAADADIAVVAASIKAYPHRFFLNIFHEPENDVIDSPGSGMRPADYADMYRRVVDQLRANGVTNVVYVWNVMGYSGYWSILDALYPGDQYVDWVCYDPYAKDNMHKNLGDLVNRTSASIGWPGFYQWATKKAPGKPLMFCEWGVDLIGNSNPASILDGDAATILAQYPMLKALVYWNDANVLNTRIDDPTEKGRAFGAAYRALANQPIFNQLRSDAG